jgi:hypothetical protein
MKAQLLIIAACAFAASVQAQNVLGFSAGQNTTYTDRCGATNIEGDAVNHYDTRDYQDCLLDPADPTGATMKFTSVRVIVQDQIGTTPDSFTFVGYTEDPLVPDFPNPAATWFRTGGINLPASTNTGPVAWIYTITIAVPAVAKGDFWLGVGMFLPPVGTTWPTDGLSTHTTWGRTVTTTGTAQRDLPGQAISLMPVPNVVCWLPVTAGVPTGPATYPAASSGQRQIWIELNANVASGVPVTQTNQTLYPSSNPGLANPLVPLGGTTNMFSGLNPDLYDFNLQTPARADDIGFLVNDVSVPSAPVFVLLAFGGSPVGSQPLATLMSGLAGAGTKGNVCIDFTAAATVLGFSNATGVFQYMLTMTPATRLAYQGLYPMNLWYQAFVLDTVSPGPGINVHATGCGVQHL